MSTDLLRVEPNQRIDYTDFDYLLNESLTGIMRDAANNFLLNPDAPAAERMRIIDGFEMTNPAGKQLSVSLGRALLAERIAGVVNYGALVSSGDASQTIDMAPLSPAVYGVFIRFEYVDADSGSRVFWNPGGLGTEFTQNISTRRNAAWSVRVELASPGAEWLQIGTADNSGGSLVIVDQRDLYFEGPINGSYASGWSSEGGGVANDRNADRKQYGVTDLQTFTAAMRQCLEDIRGRGLRRWYEKGIGGLNVGFDTDPTEGDLFVGDATFGLSYVDANDVRLYGHTGDYLRYDRNEGTYGQWQLWVNSAERFNVDDTGGVFQGGLVVGYDGTPESLKLKVGGDEFYMYRTASFNYINFNTGNSWFKWTKADNKCEFVHNNVQSFTFDTDGIRIAKGLYVGGIGVAPTNDKIYAAGDIEAGLTLRSQGDTWVGSGLNVGGATNPTTGDGIFTRGIHVGSDLGVSNDTIRCTGYIRADVGFQSGAASTPGVGDGIFSGGIVVGYDATPTDDQVRVGAATFFLDYNSGLPRIVFDNTGNSVISLGGGPDFGFLLSGSEEMTLRSTGLSIENGLYVGDATGTPQDNDIIAEGTISANDGIYAPKLGLDFNDYISWVSNSYASFYVNNVEEMRLATDGLRVANGIYVGSATGAATDNDIYAEGDIKAANQVWAGAGSSNGYYFGAVTERFVYDTVADEYWLIIGSSIMLKVETGGHTTTTGELAVAGKKIYFGSRSDNDYLLFNDSTNDLDIYIDAVLEYTFDNAGIDLHGNSLSGAGELYGQKIGRDSNDYIEWLDNTRMDCYVNSVDEFRVSTSGVAVNKGLHVGQITTTPNDNDITCDGTITAAGGLGVGAVTPTNASLYVAQGIIVGYTPPSWPSSPNVNVGDGGFGLKYNSGDPYISFDTDAVFIFYRSPDNRFEWMNDGTSQPWMKLGPNPSAQANVTLSLQSWGNPANGQPILNRTTSINCLSEQLLTGDYTAASHSLPPAVLEIDGGRNVDSNGATANWRITRFNGGDIGEATGNTEIDVAFGAYYEPQLGSTGLYNCPYIEVYSNAKDGVNPLNGDYMRLHAGVFSSGAVMARVDTGFGQDIVRCRPIMPNGNTGGAYDIGNSTGYFNDCYMDKYYGKSTTITAFDAYNDLALIDAYDPKARVAVIEKGGERRLVQEGNPATLPWPMLGPTCPTDRKPFIDISDSIFFLLGAIKQMHAKHKTEIGLLRQQVAELKGVSTEELEAATAPQSQALTLAEAMGSVARTAGNEPFCYMSNENWEPVEGHVTAKKPVILVGGRGHARLTAQEANEGMWRGIIIHPSVLEKFPLEACFMGDYIHPIRAYVKQLTLAGVPLWSGRAIRRV